MRFLRRCTLLLGLGGVLFVTNQARAQAVINNGNVALGVDKAGNLNVRSCPFGPTTSGACGTGLRHIPTGHESTFDGCPCEGWGAGVAGGAFNGSWSGADASTFGYSTTGGNTGRLLSPFASTATTARTSVTLPGT